MPTYLYKGFTNEGKKIGGSKNFRKKEELEEYLKTIDIVNTEIFDSKTPYRTRNYSFVNPRELSIFCKQMSVMFFSYITLMEGIQMLSDQTDNKVLKLTLDEIYSYMDRGYTFSESISMYEHIFGRYLIEMVSIGEESGRLDEVFLELSKYFDKEYETRRKVKNATMYPIALSTIMLLIIAFLIKEVLPIFDTMISTMGGTVSPVTGIIIASSKFLNSYILIVVVAIVVICVAVAIYFKSESGRHSYDKIKLSIPGVKFVISRIVTARFSRSLSILIKSGVDLVNAIGQCIPLIENSYLEEKFKDAYNKIKNGEELVTALEEIGIFPSIFIKMIIIGEKTGNLDQMLARSADLFEDQVDESVDKSTKVIEPILITILSIVVGIILLAVMVPMINVMQTI